MGKKSGLDPVAIFADKIAIELANEEMGEILKQFKQQSYDLKRSLSKEEFREIALNVKAVNVASPLSDSALSKKCLRMNSDRIHMDKNRMKEHR